MIKYYDNFLSNDECDKFIELINKNEPTARFHLEKSKVSDRFIDCQQTQKFYKRLLEIDPNFPEHYGPGKFVLTAMYPPNTKFGLHTDTGIYYNKQDNLQGKYTLLIYLNDDYNGGETKFYPNGSSPVIIQPKKGRCLVFNMVDLFHEGLTVKNGVKYWIGCQILGKIK